jgi:hypothetical protein
MSGAPVWDTELLRVVGMVSAAYRAGAAAKFRDAAFATPAEALRQACPELAEQVRQMETNPFFAGGAVPPVLFTGRAATLRLIKTRLGGTSLQSVSIVGERRMGKSSLLRYVCANASKLFPATNPVCIYLDLMKGFNHTRQGLMRALRQELTRALGRSPWTEAQDGDLVTLSFALEALSQQGVRLILCLDEIENLTQRKEQFDELLEELRADGQMGQVGMLAASARPLADLRADNGLESPFYNIFIQEYLGLMSEAEWQELVRKHMSVSDEDLATIGRLAGGHPFYTQLAAGRLWESRYAGGEADWQSRALADLEPHWEGWWRHLEEPERQAIRVAAGLSGPKPTQRLLKNLERRGLLREGKPFSAEFAEWVKCLE